jgi:hypothetical protein
LISRAMKLGLMAEQSQFGNDEPRNHMIRHTTGRRRRRNLEAGGVGRK